MRRHVYLSLLLLCAALYVYFLGTPWLAHVTGIQPRIISLGAGFCVILFGIAAMMIGRFASSRRR